MQNIQVIRAIPINRLPAFRNVLGSASLLMQCWSRTRLPTILTPIRSWNCLCHSGRFQLLVGPSSRHNHELKEELLMRRIETPRLRRQQRISTIGAKEALREEPTLKGAQDPSARRKTPGHGRLSMLIARSLQGVLS